MTSQPARMALAVLTVAVWMAGGWLLRLDPNSYLLVGIPYLLLFQLVVARRPVTELWLRLPSPRTLPWWTALVALPFMALPGWMLVRGWQHESWPIRLWFLAAAAGALPLAWTLVNLRQASLRCLLGCFLTAGLLGVFVMIGASTLAHHGFHFGRHPGTSLGTNFLLYLPVSFMIEEVFFRGGLDSFVQRPGDRHAWLSAALVSVLWGFWHLPVMRATSPLAIVGFAIHLPLFHLPFGLAFSTYWRRGGTLLAPAAIHAFIDSVRNVVM